MMSLSTQTNLMADNTTVIFDQTSAVTTPAAANEITSEAIVHSTSSKLSTFSPVSADNADVTTQTNVTQGQTTVAQGQTTVAQGQTTVAQGKTTVTQGQTTGEQGQTTVKQGQITVTEGQTTVEQDQTTVAQGQTTVTEGQTTVEQDQTTVAQGQTTVAQGQTTMAQGQTTVAQGQTTVAQGQTTVAQGQTTVKSITTVETATSKKSSSQTTASSAVTTVNPSTSIKTTTKQTTIKTTHDNIITTEKPGDIVTSSKSTVLPSITTDGGTTTPAPSSNTLIIAIGASVGVLVLIAIIVILVCLYKRHKNNSSRRRGSFDDLDQYDYKDKPSGPNNKSKKSQPSKMKTLQNNQQPTYFNPEASGDFETNDTSSHMGSENQGYVAGGSFMANNLNGEASPPVKTDNNNVNETEPIIKRKKTEKPQFEAEFRHSIGLLDMGTDDLSTANTYSKLYNNPVNSFGTLKRPETNRISGDTSKEMGDEPIVDGSEHISKDKPVVDESVGRHGDGSDAAVVPNEEDNTKEMVEETDPFLYNQPPQIIGSQKTTEL